jgi:hypothetical protein
MVFQRLWEAYWPPPDSNRVKGHCKDEIFLGFFFLPNNFFLFRYTFLKRIFFQIFEEFFVFVIDPHPEYSPPGGRPKSAYKKLAGAKYSRES